MKTGILYGVGVGPGDPELLTLKAARLLRDCDLAAIPQKKERCFAYKIAAQAVPELREKPVLEIEMPMTRDRSLREKAWAEGAAALGISLCEDREELHLIPGSAEDLSAALNYTGTKVFMKGNLPILLNTLEKEGYLALGAQNCGTKDEALYRSLEEIPGDAGYYTVVIAKENDQ